MKGEKGKNGPVAICPECGISGSITWDAQKDVCYCSCGWSSDELTEKGGAE